MTEKRDMIQVRDLRKSFGDLAAVSGLTFTVGAGEVFGLLGPNGAGKTTTVRMLTALLAPSSGEARVAGFMIGENDQKIRQRVGLLPEAPGLYASLTAEQNLAFFGALYGVKELDRQIQRYLKMLGLWERRFEPVGTYSKGMRQKVAIARALLHEPEILFLDEPTSGLDPQASRLVRNFIASLKEEGRTIILCTHNLEEADRLCDRVAVISGRLLALDAPARLREKIFGRKVVFHLKEQRPGLEEILGGYKFVSGVQRVDNKLVASVSDPEINNPVLVQALVAGGAEIQFVGELKRRLEDVYLELLASSKES